MCKFQKIQNAIGYFDDVMLIRVGTFAIIHMYYIYIYIIDKDRVQQNIN